MRHPDIHPFESGATHYLSSRQVLVFKTNLHMPEDAHRMAAILNSEEKIIQWNVAMDDSDRVLRVMSSVLQPYEVICLLEQAGFFCEELPD